MSAFPKYHELICGGYTPNFVAGPTPCTLQSGDVTRARLTAGGTFFRSVDNAATNDVNNISLTLGIGTPVDVGGIQTSDCTFDIVTPWGTHPTINFQQVWDTNEPAGCVGLSGPDRLRALLVGNPFVIMPAEDTPAGWLAATDDVGCLLTSFGPSLMSGALELPVASSSLRTGPAFTLFLVGDAETGDKGELTTLNAISEWDGNNWIAHPSPLFEPAFDVAGNVISPHPDCPNPTPI